MPPAVRLYGKTGTFWSLNGDTQLISEQTFDQVAWSGSDFPLGKAAGWAAFADGKLFVVGTDLTNNPISPTGTEETGTIFDPSGPSIAHTKIATTTGATSVVGNNGVTGGAFMAQAKAVLVGAETYVMMLASFPYNGWNIGTNGLFKGLAAFRKIAGTWQYDSSKSYTVAQMRASSTAGALAFPLQTNAFAESYAYDRGMSDMAPTPVSKALIVTQYFQDPTSTTKGGGITAVDPGTGTVLAHWEHPYTSGQVFSQINPRTIMVDPTGKAGDERFVVIYDMVTAQSWNIMQEFSYDSGSQTIRPTSTWLQSGSGYRWGQGAYDSEGNLWIVELNAAGLQAGPVDVFTKGNGGLQADAVLAAAGSWWLNEPVHASGDFTLTLPSGTGMPWNGCFEEPSSKTFVFHTASAQVVGIKRNGSGSAMQFTRLPTVKLDYQSQIAIPQGLGKLAPSSPGYDSANRYIYWPIGQYDTATTAPSYPSAPHALDQWIYRLDAMRLFDLPAFVSSTSGNGIAITSKTINLPAFEEGDHALAFFSLTSGSVNEAVAAGWTPFRSYLPVNPGKRYQAMWKRLVASDTSIALSWGSSASIECVIVVYRGAHPTVPIGAVDEQSGTTAANVTRPAVVTAFPNARVIGAYFVIDGSGNQTVTPAAGEIVRRQETFTALAATAVTEEETLLASGPSAARTATFSGGSSTVAAFTVALAPAPAMTLEGEALVDVLQLKRYPITFEKGVLQSLEDSAIPNGFAPRIENWSPTAAGGLRVRRGWANGGTGGPGTPNGVGVGYQSDYQRTIAVHHDGTSYQIYKTAASAPSGVLSTVGAAIAATPAYNVAMAMGQHTLVFGSPSLAKFYGVDNTGTRVDSGANAVPQNIQALAYHHNAFYAGGGKDLSGTSIPYRLFFTDPGDGAIAAWPANNYIDVGYTAGGTINALETFRDDLLVGKQDSLWVLSGTPDDALDLHRLDAGSALPGHSICATPYGAVIAGYDGVYLYDGSSVQRISRPITTSYLVGLGSIPAGDAAYFDGKAYILTSGTTLTVFVFDFDTGAWSTMALPEGFVRLSSFIEAGGKSYLVAATAGGTSARLLVNQVQYPEAYADLSGWTETFTLRTPELWLGGPVRRATVRYLDLQLRQRGTGGSGLSITPYVDGTAKTAKTVAAQGAAGSFRTRVDFTATGLTGFSCQFLATTAPTSSQASFDIEQAVILYEVEGAMQ